MDKFAALTGRQYHLFDYVGAPDAERVIVMMGSGCETAEETVELPHRARRKGRAGEGAALSSVFGRAFDRGSACHNVKAIAVLDRTKEPGSAGEPLYQDVVTALSESMNERWLFNNCLAWSAGVTACPRRSSLRRWSRPCLTS